MDEDEFITCLKNEFDVDGSIDGLSQLADDLGFDSLDIMDLVVYIEELAHTGAQILGADYPLLETIDDAYEYFESLKRQSAQSQRAASHFRDNE